MSQKQTSSFQQIDAKFFRRAKKLNRAVEITDSHAYIPAIKDSPEIRVPLPNRRLKTIEERQVLIDERTEEIGKLDEEIEVERRSLIDLVRKYNTMKSGAADVVVQNLKIQGLMEKRKTLQYPERFITELTGVTLKEIFQSTRDTRKVEGGGLVHAIKYRVEPITSLYVDLDGKAAASVIGSAEDEDVVFAPTSEATSKATSEATSKATSEGTAAPIAKTAQEIKEQAKVGAIIGQTKKVLKLKKPATAGAV